MTEAELIRIDLALEQVGGNRAQAAAILEIPKKTLHNAIQRNKALNVKWAAAGNGVPTPGAPTAPPTMMDTIDVPVPVIPPVNPTEQQLAVIYERENAALKRGFSEFGLNEEESDEAIAISRFYGKHAGELAEFFGGALTKRGMKLCTLLAKIEEDIKERKNFRDVYSPDGTMLVRSGEESKFEIYYRGIDQLRKLKELLDAGRLSAAKIKMWEQSGKAGGRGKAGKPGFSPLKRQTLVNVQPGATVHLNQNGENGKPKETPP